MLFRFVEWLTGICVLEGRISRSESIVDNRNKTLVKVRGIAQCLGVLCRSKVAVRAKDCIITSTLTLEPRLVL